MGTRLLTPACRVYVIYACLPPSGRAHPTPSPSTHRVLKEIMYGLPSSRPLGLELYKPLVLTVVPLAPFALYTPIVSIPPDSTIRQAMVSIMLASKFASSPYAGDSSSKKSSSGSGSSRTYIINREDSTPIGISASSSTSISTETSTSTSTSATQSLMASTPSQEQERRRSKGGTFTTTPMHASACTFWCAVAMGGLVQGRSLPAVSSGHSTTWTIEQYR